MDTKPGFHYKVWGRAFRGMMIGGCNMRYTNDVPGKSRIALHHAGWHWGWIGNDEFVKEKIRNTPHVEINQPHIVDNVDIEKHIKEGRDHFRPENKTWFPIKLDNYFPKVLLENKEKYADLILPDGEKSALEYWGGNILETVVWE